MQAFFWAYASYQFIFLFILLYFDPIIESRYLDGYRFLVSSYIFWLHEDHKSLILLLS